MTQASTEKNTVLKIISEMIDRVMEKDSIYQKLDRNDSDMSRVEGINLENWLEIE